MSNPFPPNPPTLFSHSIANFTYKHSDRVCAFDVTRSTWLHGVYTLVVQVWYGGEGTRRRHQHQSKGKHHPQKSMWLGVWRRQRQRSGSHSKGFACVVNASLYVSSSRTKHQSNGAASYKRWLLESWSTKSCSRTIPVCAKKSNMRRVLDTERCEYMLLRWQTKPLKDIHIFWCICVCGRSFDGSIGRFFYIRRRVVVILCGALNARGWQLASA